MTRGSPARFILALALMLVTVAPAMAVRPGNKHALDPQRTELPYEAVEFPATRDSVHLSGWWFDGPQRSPVVVVCSRGQGTMADLLPSVREFSRRGYTVLTFDYRDFGPGTPGESDTLRDVIFASRWVSDAEGALRYAHQRAPGRCVFAWGQDLGGPVAVAAGARDRRNMDGIACEGLFRTTQDQLRWNGTSQDVEVQRRHRILVDVNDEPFSAVSMLQVPLFVVVAMKDEVTPPKPTLAITGTSFSVIQHWTIPTAAHDGAELTPGYFDRVDGWFKRVAAAVQPAQP